MRALFLFFVLANLAFYAWSTLLAPRESASDPRPLRTQIDPGKIRLLPPEPETTRTPAPPPRPKPGAETAVAAQGTAACVEWGSFTLADAPNAERALEPLALGDRLSQRRVEETASWWVYLPPQGNRQNAQKKAAELKAMGVTDMFIVADEGRWRWAISLGVFRSEDAAKAQLEAMRVRGVRTALLGERELQVPKIWLQARNAEPAQLARWRELAQAFPGAEFRPCSP
jgi:hypothetical protein